MELDKRIKSKEDILTCFDIEKAKQFIGQRGYFEDYLNNYVSLETEYEYGILTEVLDNEVPFKVDNGCHWRFFIPESKLLEIKKKEFRPYTIEEFCNEGFEIVVFRDKNDESIEYHVRYNGYTKWENNNLYIILGNACYTLSNLFKYYEYLDDDGVWKPFGVEVTE